MESYSLKAVLSAIDSGFTSTMARADKMMDNFSKKYFSATKKIGKYSAVASMALGGFAIRAGANFEKGMSEVGAISRASAEDMKRLTAKAKEMGETTQFSASESAAALKYMAMAGWDTEKMVSGLPGVMNLAASSGEDLATVSDIVTDSMTAFKMEAKDAGRFADVLARASSTTNTNVSMLGESFKYVAPIAGTLGYNVEDTAVALGIMANNGIKSSMAGTSLRRALTNLASPTKKMQASMDDLGISLTNGDGSMKNLNEVMLNIRSSFKGLSKEQKAQAASTIFGKQAMAGMLSIINASDEEFSKLTKSMNNANGAADEMAKKMNDNLMGDFKLFKSALEGAAITLTETFNGGLRKTVQKMTDFVKAINEGAKALKPFMKKLDKANSLGEKLEIISDKIEPLKPLLSVLASSFAVAFSAPLISKFAMSTSTGLSRINKALSIFIPKLSIGGKMGARFAQSLGLLGKASLGILAPAMVIGILLAGLGLLYKKYGKEIDKMVDIAVKKGPSIIKGLVNGIISKLPELINMGAKMIQALAMVIVTNLPVIVQGGVALIKTLLKGIADNMDILMSSGIMVVTTIITSILDAAPELLMTGMSLIESISQGFLDNMPLIVKSIKSMVSTFTNNIEKYLPKFLKTGMRILSNLIKGVVELLPKIIPVATKAITTFIKTLADNLPSILRMGAELFMNLVKGILDNLPAMLSAAVEIITSLIRGIVSNLPAIIMTGLKLVAFLAVSLIKAIPMLLKAGVELIWGVAKGILFGIPDAFKKIWKSVTGFFSKLWGWITGRGDDGAEEFVSDFEYMKDGVSSNSREIEREVRKSSSAIYAGVASDFSNLKKETISDTEKMSDGIYGNFSAAQTDIAGLSFDMQDISSREFNQMDINAYRSLNNIQTNNRSAFAAVSRDASSSVENVRSNTVEAAYRMNNSWNRSMNNIVYKSQRSGAAIVGAFSGLSSDMNRIGYNAGAGLYNGLSRMTNSIISKARSIANSVVSTINGFLGIHSPSRVLTQSGIFSGEGFANGLDKSRSLVEKSARKMSAAVVVNSLSNKVNSIGLNSSAKIEHEINSSNARPANITLNLGGKNYRAFVDNISSAQNSIADLELSYV